MKEIEELLNAKNVDKVHFWHLVEVDSYPSDEGEDIPVCVNSVERTADGIIAYDEVDECEDGTHDPFWKVSDLSEKAQKEILWAMQNSETSN